MQVFKDNRDRNWTVAINYAAVKRVRARLGVDLLRLPADGCQLWGALHADLIGLLDVIYVLVEPEAVQQGVTDEDFGRALAGDAITRAVEAFDQELVDFFPEPAVRLALGKALRTARAATRRLLARQGARAEAIDPERLAEEIARRAEKEAAEQAALTSTGSSGSTPASSALTPAP